MKTKDFQRFFLWSEIKSIIVKNHKVVDENRFFYELQLENKTFEIDSYQSGFYKFCIKLEGNLIIEPMADSYHQNFKDDRIILNV